MPSAGEPIVVWGLGQMGGVLAHAFLRGGTVVVPLVRGEDPGRIASRVPAPALVMVCVGESDLDSVLESVPASWRDRIGLLQNELLPRDWLGAGIVDPTVAAAWFEKKKGTGVKVILPSPVVGPRAELLAGALAEVGVDARVVERDRTVRVLVEKNLYILTANLAGLAIGGGTVGDLLTEHRDVMEEVAHEVIAIQSHLAGEELDETGLMATLVRAFEAERGHGAMGRSAPARLTRALGHAHEAGIEVPRLSAIDEAQPR